MDRSMVLVSLSLLTLALVIAPTSAQSAEDDQHAQAQTLVEAGLKDARAKRFDVAVQKFDAALKLFPHPEIAHNLARAHQELGNPIEAIAAFKRALEMDASYTFADDARKRITTLDADVRKTHGVLTITSTPDAAAVTIVVQGSAFAGHLVSPVTHYVPAGPFVIKGAKTGFLSGEQTGEIAAGSDLTVELLLRPIPKKGFLTVTADVQGAEVSVDGEAVGVTPLEGHAVAAGQHRVRISAKGRQPFEVSVNVAPNTEERVSATLPVIVAASEASAGDNYGLIGGILLGSSGGMAIIAATLGVFAGDAAEEAVQYDKDHLNDYNAWKRHSDSAMAYQAGAWTTGALAVGLLGAGVWLLVLPSGDDADAATWSPVITPTDDGLGVGATLRF